MPSLYKYFIENNKVKKSEEFQEPKGTVLYEVLRVINGYPLFLEKHLDRMNNSFNIINKNNCYSDESVKKDILKLCKINEVEFGNVKITIELESDSTIKVFFIPHSYPSEKQYTDGVKTIFYFGERSNPNAKVINDDFRNSVNKAIKEADAYEGILVDRNGFITEGSRSNIFMVKGNTVITSPLEAVLPGVTRGEIIELCEENNISFKEEKIQYEKVNQLDGLFISGTSPKILPISSIGDKAFDSSNNLIIKLLMEKYNGKIRQYVNKNNVIK